MKKNTLCTVLILGIALFYKVAASNYYNENSCTFPPLTTGDLAFIAFNADGDDDLALVTFVDIDPGTELIFSDTEWDGVAFVSGEGDWIWNSGAALIPAGTMIVFNTIGASITPNIGSITFDNAGGLSQSGEAVFAYIGTDVRMPTTFITAIANHSTGYGTLSGTGLEEGVTAITLPASSDIAQYKGPRIAPTWVDLKASVNDLMNYEVQGDITDAHNDGINPDTPFSDLMFVLGTVPSVEFNEPFVSVAENGSSVTITVEVSEAPIIEGTAEISLVSGTASEGLHFSFATSETMTFPAGSTTPQTITIPIIDNTMDESDLFFVLSLNNGSNLSIAGENLFSVYILDDDTIIPVGDPAQLDVNYLSGYLVDAGGTAEITAYDAATQRLFVTNTGAIEILDFSDPFTITPVSSIDITSFGIGVQSVAVKNGLVAAAIGATTGTDNGFVLFMDVDGNNTGIVEVGVLPDMITFTPDGTKVLTANEGQPNDDYTIDPEGTISVIDVSAGLGNITQADVTTLNFNVFNPQQAALVAAGVRVFGPGASVSQDMEPEYITVSDDSQRAYVTLQENNAYAVIDLSIPEITTIHSFGLKDHSLTQNSLDTSDESSFIFNASWPIKGVYMPDAIAFYSIGGTDYIVTANEGDARDYNGYAEERKLGDADYTLDPGVFSDIDILKLETNLGDINVTAASGDADGDGLYEEIHVFGGRSFSIFEAATGTLVYDSGNDFEVITAADPVFGGIFNASNDNNNYKNRSDNKGPEPEGVLVKQIGDQFYAFILLERIGGMMVYNITDPVNPVYLQYVNNREAIPGVPEEGDLGPEGVVFIEASESPTGTALVILSNEVSATLSVYSLDNVILSVTDFENLTAENFILYPNPAQGEVTFSLPGDYYIYDIMGRLVKSEKEVLSMGVSELTTGTYIVQNQEGISQKLIIR